MLIRGGYLTLLCSSKFSPRRERRFSLYDLFTIFPSGMQTLFCNRIKSSWRFTGIRRTFLSAGRLPCRVLSSFVIPRHLRTTLGHLPSLRDISVHHRLISCRAGRLPHHVLSFFGAKGETLGRTLTRTSEKRTNILYVPNSIENRLNITYCIINH